MYIYACTLESKHHIIYVLVCTYYLQRQRQRMRAPCCLCHVNVKKLYSSFAFPVYVRVYFVTAYYLLPL